MTLAQYLSNPMGKGSSVLGNQETIKAQYAKEIEDLTSHGQTWVAIYRVGNKSIVFHYRLPSKSGSKYDPKLHYDVLFQIDQKELKEKNSPMECEFLVFSNCPSFVYTYANALYRKKQLIPYLTSLYDPATRRNAATVKNPYDILGYERSLYIGASMVRSTVAGMTASDLSNIEKRYSESFIKTQVQSQHEVQVAFRNAKDLYKQAQAVQAAIPQLGAHRNTNATPTAGSSKGVTKTRKTAKIGSIKSARKIKKI